MIGKFFLPTNVIFGKSAIKENGNLIAELGENFLVVTGKSSAKNGSLDDLLNVLKDKKVYIFNETPENPPIEIVDKVVNEYRDKNIDCVIGLGGGSPMDLSKAIAVLLKNLELPAEKLYDQTSYESALPIVCIPTTSGTGSEVTQYSVLTVNGTKKGFGNPKCTFPILAFVDPKYTVDLPKDLTISTALDALSHAIEGYISKKSNEFSDLFALKSIEIIAEYLPKVLSDLQNYEYREKLSLASVYGGITIAQTGTAIGHALGYPLTTYKNIRHGSATAVFLPFELEQVRTEVGDKVKDIENIFGGSLDKFYNSIGFKIQLSITEKEIEDWSILTSKATHIAVTPGSWTIDVIRNAYKFISKYIEVL